MKSALLLILVIFIYIPLYSSFEDRPELSETDQKKIMTGELILRKKAIKGAPWPKIEILGKVKATPIESVSVFYAYHEHKEFLPDLLESTPVRYVSPSDVHIKFEIDIPWPLKNSRYVTGNKIKRLGKNKFEIKWYLVKSNSSKESKGSVTFLPFRGETLLIYRTFIYPKNKIAKLFRKKMVKKTINSVRTIIKRIESVKMYHSKKMQNYISILNKTFEGDYVYKDIPRS